MRTGLLFRCLGCVLAFFLLTFLYAQNGFCASASRTQVLKADRRPQRNAYSEKTNRKVKRAGFVFQLPSCWEELMPDYFYAETDGKTAFLFISEADLPLEYLQFLHKPARILNDINEGMKPDSTIILDLHSVHGIPVVCETAEGSVQTDGIHSHRYQGYVVIFFNTESMQSVVISLMVSENTKFRYDSDFWKTMLSISLQADFTRLQSGFPGLYEKTKTVCMEFRHLTGVFYAADEPMRSYLWPVLQAYTVG